MSRDDYLPPRPEQHDFRTDQLLALDASITSYRSELKKQIVANSKLSAENSALKKKIDKAKADRNKAAWDGFAKGVELGKAMSYKRKDKIYKEMTNTYGLRIIYE